MELDYGFMRTMKARVLSLLILFCGAVTAKPARELSTSCPSDSQQWFWYPGAASAAVRVHVERLSRSSIDLKNYTILHICFILYP